MLSYKVVLPIYMPMTSLGFDEPVLSSSLITSPGQNPMASSLYMPYSTQLKARQKASGYWLLIRGFVFFLPPFTHAVLKFILLNVSLVICRIKAKCFRVLCKVFHKLLLTFFSPDSYHVSSQSIFQLYQKTSLYFFYLECPPNSIKNGNYIY